MNITPEQAKRGREASHWFANANRELSATELQEWNRWIADPDNRAEYGEITQLVQVLPTLQRPPLPNKDELKGSLAEAEESSEP